MIANKSLISVDSDVFFWVVIKFAFISLYARCIGSRRCYLVPAKSPRVYTKYCVTQWNYMTSVVQITGISLFIPRRANILPSRLHCHRYRRRRLFNVIRNKLNYFGLFYLLICIIVIQFFIICFSIYSIHEIKTYIIIWGLLSNKSLISNVFSPRENILGSSLYCEILKKR